MVNATRELSLHKRSVFWASPDLLFTWHLSCHHPPWAASNQWCKVESSGRKRNMSIVWFIPPLFSWGCKQTTIDRKFILEVLKVSIISRFSIALKSLFNRYLLVILLLSLFSATLLEIVGNIIRWGASTVCSTCKSAYDLLVRFILGTNVCTGVLFFCQGRSNSFVVGI